MMNFLYVGLGGFLGAISRYGISLLLTKPGGGFPVATLVANLVGCLLIGALFPWVGAGKPLGANGRLFLVVGILGGFTTFSAFGHETIDLMKGGQGGMAAGYVAASLVLGLAAVWVGRLAGSAVLR